MPKTDPLLSALLLTLTLIIASYGLSASAFLVLRWLIGEQSVWIAFFATFGALLLLPALVLLPLMLVQRQWAVAALLALPSLFFLATYGEQFLPRHPAAPDSAQRLSLVTYNLLANGSPPEARIAVIRSLNADVVAMQEVSPAFAEAVRLALSDVYPYMALHTVAAQATAGQGVLSRYPILEDAYWRYDWLYVPLGHQRVVLDVNGTRLTLYNVHPTHPGMAAPDTFFDPGPRGREIADLLGRTRTEQGAVLMAGDFNMPDLSDDYQRIRQQFADAYRTVGWGMGWTWRYTLPVPFLRLDYVFYNEAVQALSAQVGAHGGSDHAPVKVTLALPG